MPEDIQAPTISPAVESQKPKRNWKKILLILLVVLLLVSLVGVGLWLMIPRQAEQPTSPTQKQATPSGKPTTKTSPESKFKNKIFLTWEEKVGENKQTNGIYLLDLNSPPPKKILNNPDYVYPASNPTGADNTLTGLKITNDGKYMGWWKYSGTTNASVGYVQTEDLDFTEAKKLEVKQKTDYIEDFVWSPDGQKIAILERQGKGPKFTYRIRVFETKSATQVAEFQVASLEQQHSLGFSWSQSDKLRVIFDTNYTPTEEYKAVSYSPTGTKEFEKILHSGDSRFRPVFSISDDGETVSFVKNFQVGNNYRGELWYGGINGSGLKKIKDLPKEICIGGSGIISPNKKSILLFRTCGSKNNKSQILDIASGKLITTEVSGSGTWSPDSSKIWISETLYEPLQGSQYASSPISSANYIISKNGKIIKKLDFYSANAVWFP